MDSVQSTFNELIASQVSGPKVSLYAPLTGTSSDERVFSSMRNQALRLLEKSGDSGLSIAFAQWSLKNRPKFSLSEKQRTLALFFSSNLRKIAPISCELPPRVIVAESFHVKPLLYLRSEGISGHLIEFHRSGVTIWKSIGDEIEVLDYVQAPIPDTSWPTTASKKLLNQFLRKVAGSISYNGLVQISGAPAGIGRSHSFWREYFPELYIDSNPFGFENREEARREFLSLLNLRKQEKLNLEVTAQLRSREAYWTPEGVLRGIREKRVSRLYVSLEAVRWGVINPDTGLITYHHHQIDHRDEDILDDLAELAVKNGVDVRVLKQAQLPKKIYLVAS